MFKMKKIFTIICCVVIVYVIALLTIIIHELGHYYAAIYLNYSAEIHIGGLRGKNYCTIYTDFNKMPKDKLLIILVTPAFSVFAFCQILHYISTKTSKPIELSINSVSSTANIANILGNFLLFIKKSDSYLILKYCNINLPIYITLMISLIITDYLIGLKSSR